MLKLWALIVPAEVMNICIYIGFYTFFFWSLTFFFFGHVCLLGCNWTTSLSVLFSRNFRLRHHRFLKQWRADYRACCANEGNLAVSSLVSHSVWTNIVFGWGLRWAGAPAHSARILPPLPWLQFKGTLGNQRDGDRSRDTENQGSCFTLFQDIIEPI